MAEEEKPQEGAPEPASEAEKPAEPPKKKTSRKKTAKKKTTRKVARKKAAKKKAAVKKSAAASTDSVLAFTAPPATGEPKGEPGVVQPAPAADAAPAQAGSASIPEEPAMESPPPQGSPMETEPTPLRMERRRWRRMVDLFASLLVLAIFAGLTVGVIMYFRALIYAPPTPTSHRPPRPERATVASTGKDRSRAPRLGVAAGSGESGVTRKTEERRLSEAGQAKVPPKASNATPQREAPLLPAKGTAGAATAKRKAASTIVPGDGQSRPSASEAAVAAGEPASTMKAQPGVAAPSAPPDASREHSAASSSAPVAATATTQPTAKPRNAAVPPPAANRGWYRPWQGYGPWQGYPGTAPAPGWGRPAAPYRRPQRGYPVY